MAQIRIKLAHKLTILLILSFLVQLGLFAHLFALQTETEQVFKKAFKAKEISESINKVERNLVAVTKLLHGVQLSAESIDTFEFTSLTESTAAELAKLKGLAADDPEFDKVVEHSQSALNRYLLLLKDLRESTKVGSLPNAGRHPLSDQVVQEATQIVSDPLIAAGKQSKIYAEANDARQMELRQRQRNLLHVYLALIIAFTVLSAWLMIYGISRRLQIISENIARLPSGKPLQPVPGQSDEIAELNDAFHSMIRQLNEAAHKEMSTVENARDLICSLDKGWHFDQVNQSSKELLGFSNSEMHGAALAEHIDAGSIYNTLDTLELVKKEGVRTFETQMLSKDGQRVDTLWTAFWSEPDERTYCVIHDTTISRSLDRMKHDIAVMATHDLRSPLTAIDNYFEMLQAGSFGSLSPQGNSSLKEAVHNTKGMMALINDFLDLEKIDSGMMNVHAENIFVSELFLRCCETLEENESYKNVKLEVELGGTDVDDDRDDYDDGDSGDDDSPSDLLVYADESIMHNVLTRIVLFIIEKARHNSLVKLTGRRGSQHALISIVSEESEISLEEARAIFQRFKISHDDSSHSSLLGLYACKTFVELNNGFISVELTKERKLIFGLTLPLGGHQI